MKRLQSMRKRYGMRVAPRAGAWIETLKRSECKRRS